MWKIYSETENPAINQFNIPQSDVKWKYSLYANGESAIPDESGSIFTKVTDKQYNKSPIPYFISPYDQATTPVANGISSVFITLMNKNIDTPFDGNSKSIMNIFLTETDMMAFYLSSQMPAEITVPSFVPASSKAVTLLGSKKALKWRKGADGGMVVTLPESMRKNPPCQHIWCLKIKVK